MNKMIKQIRHKTPRHARGFTLVEMMVTMVIVSVVLAATYQAFGDTSAAMYEVDSLAGTLDKGRFALEIMSRDVQSAGAFASPDARTDALSYGEQIGTSNVYGLYAFDGARVQIEPLQSEFNRATASDEIIVLGAYDYPVNFEVSFPGGDLAHPFAPNIHRGALRFRQLDPFNVNLIDAMGEALTTEEQGPLVGLMLSRLLRVTDRNGYSQFAPITATTYNPDVNSGGLNFTVGSGAMTFRERPADGLKGFEPASEDDAFYSAAILDVYRYRVCADPYDGTSLKLVRERLDANTVVSGAALPRPQVCGAGSIGVGNAIVSQDTIVDRVVDFRVWYDCADPTSRLMEGVTWHDGWFPPDGDDAGHNCVYLNATGAPLVAGSSPSLARMAHMRLSVRTDREFRDLPNYGFLRANGDSVNLPSMGTPPPIGDLNDDVVSGLKTFDVDGDESSAASVVTLQVDVNLTNFGNRERIQTIQRDAVYGGAEGLR